MPPISSSAITGPAMKPGSQAVQPAGKTSDAEGGDLEPGVAHPHRAEGDTQQGGAGVDGAIGVHDGRSLKIDAIASI